MIFPVFSIHGEYLYAATRNLMQKPCKPAGDFFSEFRTKPSRQGFRAHSLWWAARAFSGSMRLVFHLLYYPLSFTYDTVAWTVSGGEWADWRRCVLPHLLPGRVLELAHGTGTLALDMTERGFTVTAVDLSPAMGKIALRKKKGWELDRSRQGLPAAGPALVRADVRQLPFSKDFFSSAVSTFPADFIFMPQTLQEIYRALHPGGRWIIVPTASPEWLAGRLIPQADKPSPQDVTSVFVRHLEATGFSVRVEVVRQPRSRVVLVVAEKPGALP